MRTFILIWVGQVLSLLGSAMTRFVLMLWLWDQTGSATSMVLVGVVTGVLSLLASLIAGPVIDRASRKRVILTADGLAGMTTIALFVLVSAGRLAPWQVYLFAGLSGVFGVFHSLAFTALITSLVPKEQYTRANSLRSIAFYASSVGAPVIAGLLVGPLGVPGVMLFDIGSFLFAVGTLAVVRIPGILHDELDPPQGWASITFGFRYIFARPPLRGLMLVLFAFIFLESFGYPLMAPMILARTGGDEITLGVIQSVLGIGGVVGGVVVAVWGGFRRRVHGVLLGLLLTGLLGDALMGFGAGLAVWIPAAIFIEVFIPLVFSSDSAIWQSKVPPHQQGRVFAARNIMTDSGEPVAMLLAGLLSDHIFEPAMRPGGALVPIFGGLIRPGPGAGMALLLVGCGVLCAAAAVSGYLSASVRRVETLLPDHDEVSVI